MSELRLLDVEALLKSGDAQWLVDGLLPARGLAFLVGRFGAGKTFLALDLALHISNSMSLWHGHALRCVNVFYAYSEGLLKSRVAAWRKYNDPEDWPPSITFGAGAINLLDNACKFTPKYGCIEVRGYPFFWERRAKLTTANINGERRSSRLQAPNAFRVDICDSGPGVPFEHLEKIFEEYTSYSGGQDRSGGGLGLAICKFILNLHQGQVWAESGTDGSTFSFVLPFVQEAQLTLMNGSPRQVLQAGA